MPRRRMSVGVVLAHERAAVRGGVRSRFATQTGGARARASCFCSRPIPDMLSSADASLAHHVRPPPFPCATCAPPSRRRARERPPRPRATLRPSRRPRRRPSRRPSRSRRRRAGGPQPRHHRVPWSRRARGRWRHARFARAGSARVRRAIPPPVPAIRPLHLSRVFSNGVLGSALPHGLHLARPTVTLELILVAPWRPLGKHQQQFQSAFRVVCWMHVPRAGGPSNDEKLAKEAWGMWAPPRPCFFCHLCRSELRQGGNPPFCSALLRKKPHPK